MNIMINLPKGWYMSWESDIDLYALYDNMGAERANWQAATTSKEELEDMLLRREVPAEVSEEVLNQGTYKEAYEQ